MNTYQLSKLNPVLTGFLRGEITTPHTNPRHQEDYVSLMKGRGAQERVGRTFFCYGPITRQIIRDCRPDMHSEVLPKTSHAMFHHVNKSVISQRDITIVLYINWLKVLFCLWSQQKASLAEIKERKIKEKWKEKKRYKERERQETISKKKKVKKTDRKRERQCGCVCGPALYFILETRVGGSHNVHHHISFKNKHFKIADPQKKTRWEKELDQTFFLLK